MPPQTHVVDDAKVEEHAYMWTQDKMMGTEKKRYKFKIQRVIYLIFFHSLTLYFLIFKPTAPMWQSHLWTFFYLCFSGFGISAGIHRYWSHKSFKARLPLKILLAMCFAAAGQEKILNWVRDHRIHHKFSETEADPHDSRRGFIFAHFGWLVVQKNPQVYEKGRIIDMSDILSCPVVSFHDRHFEFLRAILCFAIPIGVPVYFWDEDLWISFLYNCFRFAFVLNCTFAINSFAHMRGTRPYDRNFMPVDNSYVTYVTMGEGNHNYHHAFPFDYRSTEMICFNPTKSFIEFFQNLGWAFDLRVASDDMVRKRVKRTGDGSHKFWGTVGGVPVAADENLSAY